MTPTDPRAIAADLDTTWVIVAGVLVMFMQAGFALLEIGFSRGKNVGAVVAKILTNFSVASIVWWACGFAIAFGGAGWLAGDSGFFYQHGSTISPGSLVAGTADGHSAAFFFFQFVFCAVSLAIVWGTTLERIKFIAYPIYAIVFCAVIYHSSRTGSSAAGSSPRWATGSRTSPAPRSSICPVRPGRSRRCCCSGRAGASTGATAGRARSRATPCRSSASAC
jgi:hypothetical protein